MKKVNLCIAFTNKMIDLNERKIYFIIVHRGYLSISNNHLFFHSPLFKKIFYAPLPILFFQTLNVVMLIVSAKFWNVRGTSHQPAVMVSYLTISHTCFPSSGSVSDCVPVLIKWEVAAILGNGCAIQGQNCAIWLQRSKTSVGGW